MTDSIDIIQPDDFHHHLRDDTVLGLLISPIPMSLFITYVI